MAQLARNLRNGLEKERDSLMYITLSIDYVAWSLISHRDQKRTAEKHLKEVIDTLNAAKKQRERMESDRVRLHSFFSGGPSTPVRTRGG